MEQPEATQEQLVADLGFLSETAMELLSLKPGSDLYEHLAQRLQYIVEDAWIAVSSYDARRDAMSMRAVAGMGSVQQRVLRLAEESGGRTYRKVTDEARQSLLRGRLDKVPGGMYELLFREIPRPVARAIEQLGNIGGIYIIGCTAAGQLMGAVVIALRQGNELKRTALVETFVRQVAVAIQRAQTQEALRESETQVRAIMDQVDDAILLLDDKGVILDVNRKTCEVAGTTRESLFGKSISFLLDPEDLKKTPLRLDLLQAGKPFYRRRFVQLPNGDKRLYEGHISPLGDGRALIIASDITERRRTEEKVLEIGEQERRRIGRDLHDSLGQQLAGIAFLVSALARDLKKRGLATDAGKANKVGRLLKDAIEQTRRLARGLSPVDVGGRSIQDSLTQLAEETTKVFGTQCRCRIPERVAVKDSVVATNLYHIAQESITNAVRHGKATEIVIGLEKTGENGELVVQDDGTGLPEGWDAGDTMGIRIMSYRAELIGGRFEIGGNSGRGTVVRCSFRDKHPADAGTRE